MANSTIGKLSVVLTARTAGLQRGLSKASAMIGRVGKAARIAGLAVAGVGAAGLAAAAGGLAAFTRAQLEQTDALAKNADRLGLSTEQMAAYNLALEHGGANLETGATAMQRMNRRIADAAKGTGAAAEAFQALGLDAGALAEMNPLEAFALIGERLAAIENTAERTSIQFKIFDTEGGKLFATLRGGAEGMAFAAEQARLLGLTISRTDAAAIENANDAMTRMRRIFDGIGRQLAVAVAPLLEAVADRMTALATSGGGVGVKVRAAVAAALNGFARLLDGVHRVGLGVAALGVQFLQWRSTALGAIADVLARVSKYAGVLAALPGGAAIGKLTIAGAAGAGAAANQASEQLIEAGRRLSQSPADSPLAETIREFARQVLTDSGGGAADDVAPKLDETNDRLEDLRDAIDRQTDALVDQLANVSAGDTSSLLGLIDRLSILAGYGGLGRAV